MSFSQNSTFGFGSAGSGGGTSSGLTTLYVVCGDAGGPVAGLTTYQNNTLIGATRVDYIWVNKNAEQSGGAAPDFSFNSGSGTITRPSNLWNTGDTLLVQYVPVV